MNKSKSFKESLQFSNIITFLVAVIPLIFNAIFFLVSMTQYNKIIETITTTNSLEGRVQTDLYNELWLILSEQSSTTNRNDKEIINSIREELVLLGNDLQNTSEVFYVDVSKRLLNSIENLCNNFVESVEDKNSFNSNELLLNDIQNTGDMLIEVFRQFSNAEINLATNSNKKMTHSLIVMSGIQLIFLVIITLFLFRNSKILNRDIQQPVQEIEQLTKQVASGDFDVQIEKPNIEELDDLVLSLNSMVRTINDLIQENKNKQDNLKRAEFKVLQEQITPHFVYNSLDAILALAEQEDNEKVIDITYALSNFFRISLSNGNEWIPVERELEHVKNYLTILQIRYANMLEFSIELSQLQNENQKILKMILQPIVENAVYHGTKNVRRIGLITISVFDDADFLFLKIEDNGAGISADKLETIQHNLEFTEREVIGGGYGLYNVYNRIILYYGENATIDITSTEGIGTTTLLTLPKL